MYSIQGGILGDQNVINLAGCEMHENCGFKERDKGFNIRTCLEKSDTCTCIRALFYCNLGCGKLLKHRAVFNCVLKVNLTLTFAWFCFTMPCQVRPYFFLDFFKFSAHLV